MALALAAPLLQPGAALAAYSSAAPVVAAATPDNVCMGAACMGGAFTLLTLLLTARFLLSFFPRLERQALARQWPYSAVTVLDPVLQPVKRHLFALEETDPDYAAVAVLAVATGLLECLVGEYGLLVHAIPDFQLVRALQQLIIVQHCFLLPSWCLVVLRWASVM